MKSKHRSGRHARATRPFPPPPAPRRDVLRRLFPQPYLALGTPFGDPVPTEWHVFKAEAEDALRHPYRVRARR